MEAQGTDLGSRLAQLAPAAMVGRESMRIRLRGLLVPGQGPAVVFVWGPGGIGKSMLVAATVAELGEQVLTLAGDQIEPTPAGFLSALSAGLGDPIASPAQAGTTLRVRDVLALVVDSFERLNLLDGWLRNEFLVRVPTEMTTVLVGRRPPNLAWRTAPAWRALVAEMVVTALPPDDARRLLARHSLPAPVAQRVLRFAGGHPLALQLAAEAFTRHPDLELPEGPPAEVLEELFEVLLADLTPSERDAVERASVLRRVTQPLLAAVLADGNGGETLDLQAAWRTLRGLPYTLTTPRGLEFEAVARSVIAGGLEIRDPARVSQLRARAGAAAVRDAGNGRSWEATADLLYLVQNPVIRNSYVPSGDQQHPVEMALDEDLADILEITTRYDGAAGAELIEAWWHAHRSGFVVGRGPAGAVTAFSVVVRLTEVDRRLAEVDPVLEAFLGDLARRPLPPGSEALLHRRALGRRRGEYPSPELGAMVVDIKRSYLELRPALTRVLATVADFDALGSVLRALGFSRTGPPVRLADATLQVCALDFGPGSVDGWLLRHILRESGSLLGPVEAVPAQPVEAPTTGAALAVAGLSAREREVLAVLAEGATNREVADRLFISERTVNRHLSNIFTKLGVVNRTAAARIAIAAGLAG